MMNDNHTTIKVYQHQHTAYITHKLTTEITNSSHLSSKKLSVAVHYIAVLLTIRLLVYYVPECLSKT